MEYVRYFANCNCIFYYTHNYAAFFYFNKFIYFEENKTVGDGQLCTCSCLAILIENILLNKLLYLGLLNNNF